MNTPTTEQWINKLAKLMKQKPENIDIIVTRSFLIVTAHGELDKEFATSQFGDGEGLLGDDARIIHEILHGGLFIPFSESI